MKLFKEEIKKFHNKLINNDKFAFSKFADGEWLAINNIKCAPGNGEWTISNSLEHSYSRQLLINSFTYKHPDYYVGISCPCCQGKAHYDMIKFSGQSDENLTFANIFVNSNYEYFLENIVPEFTKKENIILVANKNSNLNNLPFKVQEFYGVGYNAWIDDLPLVKYLIEKNHKDKLFLFSCGPLGNILSHLLWSYNKDNTYLDIGSTIDKWLNNDIKNKRCYAIGITEYSNKECVWGD